MTIIHEVTGHMGCFDWILAPVGLNGLICYQTMQLKVKGGRLGIVRLHATWSEDSI